MPLTTSIESASKTASCVPLGVDAGRYHRRFLENVPRLFQTQSNFEELDIIRVLPGQRGKSIRFRVHTLIT
jgi:hypothetical protein